MIEEPQIKRLSAATNAPVVQLPERKLPGVVVQGDSLRNLASLAGEIVKQIEAGRYAEAGDLANEVDELLGGYLDSYEAAVGASPKARSD
ncbi:hypothetical protein [Botrimarina sp.]|uniref:DUF6959 family protein n=1 Tax=Botrimarina sp. TaxID=2795802 RepID=UPI0032EDF8FA